MGFNSGFKGLISTSNALTKQVTSM